MAIFTADTKVFDDFVESTTNMVNILEPLADAEEITSLKRFIENFKIKTADFFRENRKLNIGIIGQVKAGKSSFLNTLLFDGKEILPKASTPKTATLTKMEYSEQNIIQIEYYSVEEWDVLQDNAVVDLEDDKYTSAREIINMVKRSGFDPLPYLQKGIEQYEFASYDDLIEHLNDYVGEDGKFTPVVKAVTLYLNKEEFKGLSIVDTPGLNDPIPSRTTRTKEFMEVCDVVFFLSQSGSFLDKSDWTLLSSQLPQKGVKKLILIASKYDSGIRDVLRVKDADDEFDEDENTTDNISVAYKIIRKKLRKRAKSKVEEFVRDLEQRDRSPELIAIIKECTEPLLISAMAHNMLSKDYEEYSSEEKNVYNALKVFSKDMQSDLALLGSFAEVQDIFDNVIAEKETILEQKSRSFIPTAHEELKTMLREYREKASTRVEILENNDKEKLGEQKKFMETQISGIKADITTVFNELSVNLEKEKAAGIREMREISKDFLEMKERTGERVHVKSYRVSDSKWYKPWTWGSSHTVHYTYTEHYSYCIASDAVENIRKFSMDAVNQIEKIFTEAIDQQALKRKLLNLIVQNFDMGSEKYDAALFRIMVENTINKIEFPVFKIDISKSLDAITAKFTGEITDAEQKNALQTALDKAISRIYDELSDKVANEVISFKNEIQNLAKSVESDLLNNINQEFDLLISQYNDKEKEIARYQAYILALKQEEEKL